jgi:hypothetical protein
VNPEGPFEIGGPSVHAGLTGRKNAIDTYGEYARHSGAALSGKDQTREPQDNGEHEQSIGCRSCIYMKTNDLLSL